MTLVTVQSMRYVYKFIGATGIVDSKVFQRSVDYPDEYGPGYHVVLDGERGYCAGTRFCLFR